MAEYINREELERLMCEQVDGVRLDDVPSIDIVHCKDCKRYVSDGGALMVCDITGNPVPEDDYCSCGKRKEQEHEDKNN